MVATLLEAAAPRAAAGSMATAAAMQDAISTKLTGAAETIDEYGMGNGDIEAQKNNTYKSRVRSLTRAAQPHRHWSMGEMLEDQELV